jgi:hypothetical protein
MSGLSRQVEGRFGVVMVHQESTGSGGRGVVPGQVVDGSWKADRGRRKGMKSRKNECSSSSGASQDSEARGLAGDKAMAIYRTSK